MKRLLIIHPEGNTFNNPTLKCVVDLLLDRKVEVDIRGFKIKPNVNQRFGLRLLSYGRFQKKLKSLIYDKICSILLGKLFSWMEYLFIYRRYDLILGVDREGLIEASILAKIAGIPYDLFSFEIMFLSETSKKFKRIEIEASKYIRNWFIQDEVRAEQLQIENGLNPTKRVILPVSSLGLGEIRTQRLRDQLGIPTNKKVAILAGSLVSWSMASEIINSVKTWHDDWVLIVHDRYGLTSEALISMGIELNSLPREKVFFSHNSPIMVDDMGEILSGISAGFAFYKPIYNDRFTGKNLKYLGLSSGKIATYLRYGIPPIMNEIGSYADMAKKYQFGIVVQNENEIANSLMTLQSDSFRLTTLNYYKEHLDFSRYADIVWNKLALNR